MSCQIGLQWIQCRAGRCGYDDSSVVVPNLAAGVDALAVDADGIYWIDGNQSVGMTDKHGGNPRTWEQTPYAPTSLRVDAAYVYWANSLGGAIMRVAKAGGAPEVFAAATSPTVVAIASDSTVYWVEGATIRSAPETGGSPTLLTTVASPINDLAIDSAYVYAAETTAQIERIARAGAARSVIATCPPLSGSTPTRAPQVAIDGDGIYFTCDEGNGIRDYPYAFAQSWDGSCTRMLAGADDSGSHLIVDGPWVYLHYFHTTSSLGGPPFGMVAKIPKFGGDLSELVPEKDGGVSGDFSGDYPHAVFAVDDTDYYYSVGVDIRRHPK
jgi:hypothetical protein